VNCLGKRAYTGPATTAVKTVLPTQPAEAWSLRCCFATLPAFFRRWCAPAGSFDDRHQPFRQFALHHVVIHQPQDSPWYLGVTLKAG
jgi:hypothetical protein